MVFFFILIPGESICHYVQLISKRRSTDIAKFTPNDAIMKSGSQIVSKFCLSSESIKSLELKVIIPILHMGSQRLTLEKAVYSSQNLSQTPNMYPPACISVPLSYRTFQLTFHDEFSEKADAKQGQEERSHG